MSSQQLLNPPEGFSLDPPQGFSLDKPTGVEPPPGFALDKSAEKEPGILGTMAQAGIRGVREGVKDTAGVVAPFAQPTAEETQPKQDTSYVGKLLNMPMDEGLRTAPAHWAAAQLAYGIAKTSPSLAAGIAGGAAGTAVEPGIGTLLGGAAGFGVGSMAQEIRPAFVRAKAAGLSDSDAVDRALTETGIAGVAGTAMGLLPGASVFGREAAQGAAETATEAGLRLLQPYKRPIAEAMVQIFGGMPAVGVAQQVAQGAVEGKMPTPGELGAGYVENVGVGAVLAGVHALARGVMGGGEKPPTSAKEPATTGTAPPDNGGGPGTSGAATSAKEPAIQYPLEPHFDPISLKYGIKDQTGKVIFEDADRNVADAKLAQMNNAAGNPLAGSKEAAQASEASTKPAMPAAAPEPKALATEAKPAAEQPPVTPAPTAEQTAPQTVSPPHPSSEVAYQRRAEEPAPLENRIYNAFLNLTGKWNARADLANLRAALPDVPRADLDAALIDMQRQGKLSLWPNDNKATLTDYDREAAINVGGEPRHMVWIEKGPEGAAYERATAPLFYSALERAITGLRQDRATPEQWMGIIRNLTSKGVKGTEIEHSGIMDYLKARQGAGDRDIAKDDITRHVLQSMPTFEDRQRTGMETRFDDDQYRLPGGKDYTESPVQMTSPVPGGGTFTHQHFPGVANLFGHTRYDTRTGPNGEKILHVHEIQHDWHQQGRQKGYGWHGRSNDFIINDIEDNLAELIRRDPSAQYNVMAAFFRHPDLENRRRELYMELASPKYGPPDAPLKRTEDWSRFLMKRLIRHAAENSYDKIEWDTGAEQIRRYSNALSRNYDRIEWTKTPDGYRLVGKLRGDTRADQTVKKDELSDAVGGDMAKQITESPEQSGAIEGNNIRVDNIWPKKFYDQMLPKEIGQYIKQWGSKVEDGTTSTGPRRLPHEIDRALDGDGYNVIDPNSGDVVGWYETIEEAEAGLSGFAKRNGDDVPPQSPVHTFAITPQMKADVLHKGQPLFQAEKAGAPVVSGTPISDEQMTPHVNKLIGDVDALVRRIAPGAESKAYATLSSEGGEGVNAAFIPDRLSGIGHLIAWSLESPDAEWSARHEAVHYLYRAGFFEPREWKVLTDNAERGKWADAHDIAKRYPDLPPERQTEEAIAEQYAKWGKGEGAAPTTTAVGRIFLRMRDMLGNVAAMARRVFGLDATPEDIFRRIESGEIGNRPDVSKMTPRDAEAAFQRLPPAAQQLANDLNATMDEQKQRARGPLALPVRGIEAIGRAASDSMLGRLTRRVIAPGAYDQWAKVAARGIRAAFGHSYVMDMQMREALRSAEETVGKMSDEDKNAFAIAMDTGGRQATPELQAIADNLKQMTQEATRRLQGVGKLQNAMENYLGRIWKPRDESVGSELENTNKVLGLLASKKSLSGPGSFLKPRYYETYQEALDVGLEPRFDNPITTQIVKLMEMNRYYAGTLLANGVKTTGIARFIGIGNPIPEGFMEMAGPEFMRKERIIQKPDGTSSIVPEGAWFAPEGYARVYNNYVSRGLSDTPFGEAYKAMRDFGNAMNMMQLGLSAFHPVFTTIDAQVSRIGLGIDQAMRGEFGKAAGNIVGGISPTNWWQNINLGNKMYDAILGGHDAPPEMQRLVKAFGAAGGRVFMQRVLRPTDEGAINVLRKGAIGEALRNAANKYPDSPIRRVLNVAGRALQTTSAPIMDVLVPRQKLGVFARLAQDWMQANPEASNVEFAAKMQDIWDTVDNRLGQMVYDNIFWHKTLKDLSFLTVRSVGWNMGSLREIGGGMAEAGKFAMDAAAMRSPEWTRRMSYLIALPIMTGIYGAMYQYLATGKGPEELKDYFFPKSGTMKTTKIGGQSFTEPDSSFIEPDRVSIPSYIRDVGAWYYQPGQTAQNKLHPEVSMFADAIAGHDYYGHIIANRDDPFLKQVEDSIGWALSNVMPFSIQGTARLFREQPGPQAAVGMLGFTPSPLYITTPEAEEAWDKRRHKQDVAAKKSYERKQQQLENTSGSGAG